MKLRNNNNYFESFEKLAFIDKTKLASIFFRGSEESKLFVLSHSKFIELESLKPCIRCGKSFKRGRMAFNRFHCCFCLLPASHENAKAILKNALNESES